MILNVDRETLLENSFTSFVDFFSVPQTTEYPLIILKNPSGSGKKIVVTHFNFSCDSAITRAKFKIYANPTITSNGTSLSIINNHIKGSPLSSVSQVYRSPTMSSNGSLLSCALFNSNHASSGQNRVFYIDENNSLLITATNDVINVQTFAQIYWIEL